jgi:hypothetical protein
MFSSVTRLNALNAADRLGSRSALLPLFCVALHLVQLDTSPLVAVSVWFNVLRLIEGPLPFSELVNVRFAGNAFTGLAIFDVEYPNFGPLMRLPIGDVHAGIKTDSVEIHAGVQRLHRFLHRHLQPLGTLVLVPTGLADD